MERVSLVRVDYYGDEVLGYLAVFLLVFLHFCFLFDLVLENPYITPKITNNKLIPPQHHLTDPTISNLEHFLALVVSPQEHIPINCATYHVHTVNHAQASHGGLGRDPEHPLDYLELCPRFRVLDEPEAVGACGYVVIPGPGDALQHGLVGRDYGRGFELARADVVAVGRVVGLLAIRAEDIVVGHAQGRDCQGRLRQFYVYLLFEELQVPEYNPTTHSCSQA